MGAPLGKASAARDGGGGAGDWDGQTATRRHEAVMHERGVGRRASVGILIFFFLDEQRM
jgi:hypothetical protein